jgi:Ca2+-binding RTX toxin-like protein
MPRYEPRQGDWKHTYYGTDEGEWLIGESSDDTMYANGGNDSASGNHGSDIIDGGNGNDTIIGGTGTDWLTGGRGADQFRLHQGDGVDVIYDFHPEQGDRLLVQDDGQYTVAEQDGDTYIDFGNGVGVVLEGFTGWNPSYVTFFE